MLNLLPDPDVTFVNQLIASIQDLGSCTDESFKRITVRLSTCGAMFKAFHGPKRCHVEVHGGHTVEYTFADVRGLLFGKRHESTVDNVEDVAKAIIQYFDKKEFPSV